jgi:hypothetical protein
MAGNAGGIGMTTEVNLNAISPKRGSKYSPNLHKWLSGKSAGFRKLVQVFRDEQGILYIGFKDDLFFNGSKLIGVLCNGNKEPSWAHQGPDTFTLVPDFWERYTAVGRCAIDDTHTMTFQNDDDRWKVKGDERCCTWCNQARQLKIVKTEIKTTEHWVPHPSDVATQGATQEG